MAIQFARCEYVSRSTGGNACRKAAYNERSSIQCERTGETFSFEHKGEAAHHEVLLPEGANARFEDSSTLWNEAEWCERRKDSQVAKEFVLALPDDAQVTLEDRIELTRRFASSNFVEKGVAVQIDIHEPDAEEKNWHAHLLVTTRRFAEDGETLSPKKANDLDPVVRGASHTVLEADLWGEIWRDVQNTYFEEKGYDIRVDPIAILSQETQGSFYPLDKKIRVHCLPQKMNPTNLFVHAWRIFQKLSHCTDCHNPRLPVLLHLLRWLSGFRQENQAPQC